MPEPSTPIDSTPPSSPARGGWTRAFLEDNAAWGLGPRGAVAHLALPVATTVLYVALYALAKDVLRAMTDEDALVEWLQVLLFAAGMIAGLASAWSLWRAGRRAPAALFGLFGLGLLFVVGEELAWGQRVLGFATPSVVEEVNEKGELSVHNIPAMESLFIAGQIVAGVVGGIVPWVLLGRRRPAWLELLVAPTCVTGWFLLLLGMRGARRLVTPDTFPVGFTEFVELLLAAGLAAYAYLVWRRVRHAGGDRAPTGILPPMSEPPPRGLLIVISGPSGAGKTTIAREVERRMDASFSVSVTTRPKTAADVEGRDYRFLTHDEFDAMVEAGELLEHAEVFGRDKYGTPRRAVEEMLAGGRLVILEIDVQGGLQVRRAMPEAFMIFVLPPSEKELLRRLRDRRREDEQTIQRRFEEAQREIRIARESGAYDVFIVNDDLERAIDEACRRITRQRDAAQVNAQQ